MPSPSLCVYCRARAVEDRWRPFCSERCKMADLGRWLSDEYRVPDASGVTDGEDDERGAATPRKA